jgi:hypothetical protein
VFQLSLKTTSLFSLSSQYKLNGTSEKKIATSTIMKLIRMVMWDGRGYTKIKIKEMKRILGKKEEKPF